MGCLSFTDQFKKRQVYYFTLKLKTNYQKIILGAFLLFGITFAANAVPHTVTITTSCGTSHRLICDGCTTNDLITAAIALDLADCVYAD